MPPMPAGKSGQGHSATAHHTTRRDLSACAQPNPSGSRFCNECGTRFTSLPLRHRPSVPAPEAYIPEHLAEKILTSKSALEGERKQVTVCRGPQGSWSYWPIGTPRRPARSWTRSWNG